MDDYYSLISALSGTSTSTFNAAESWRICTVIIAALGTAALFVFFTYLKKGAEKRNFVEDIKNFFLFKGNFAEDLARICFYYIAIYLVMNALQTLTTGGDPWGFFTTLFSIAFYRFVYEAAIAIIRFCKGEKK